jgi:hypothetical protein
MPQARNGACCADSLKKWGVDWTRTFSESKFDLIKLNKGFSGNKSADLALLVYPTTGLSNSKLTGYQLAEWLTRCPAMISGSREAFPSGACVVRTNKLSKCSSLIQQ